MNADGTRIAFTSSNGIKLYDTTTQTFTPITPPGSQGLTPAINANGTRLAFASNANLTGGNPDGNFEIFLYDIATGAFTQITNTDTSAFGPNSGCLNPALNADGTRIAYGFQPADASYDSDIYLYDTTTGASTRITNAKINCPIGRLCSGAVPAINANGTRITYASNNGDVGLYDTTTGTSTLIPHGNDISNQYSAINANGARIAVNAYPYGFNLYDTTTGTPSQFTTYPGYCCTITSHSAPYFALVKHFLEDDSEDRGRRP